MGDADRLISGMRALGDTLQATFGDLNNLEWVDPVVIALDGSPYCTGNPVCVTARDQFRQLQTARNDGTLKKLADQLQSTGPLSNLSQTVTKLTQSMNSLTGPMGSLGLAHPGGGVQSPLGNMQQGLDSLADGSRQLADGVQELVEQSKRMGADLGKASAFLLAMKNDASTPSMAGFYIPQQMLNSEDFKKAAKFFISADGHAARYLVETNSIHSAPPPWIRPIRSPIPLARRNRIPRLPMPRYR